MKQINKSKIYVQIQKRTSAWKGLQSKTETKNPIFHKIRKLHNLAQYERRSNQRGIFKSNTVPQLAEAVIIDRNSKDHPQNEGNQKELSQLKKHFTKSKECQGRGHLIYYQASPSSKLCMFTLCVI